MPFPPTTRTDSNKNRIHFFSLRLCVEFTFVWIQCCNMKIVFFSFRLCSSFFYVVYLAQSLWISIWQASAFSFKTCVCVDNLRILQKVHRNILYGSASFEWKVCGRPRKKKNLLTNEQLLHNPITVFRKQNECVGSFRVAQIKNRLDTSWRKPNLKHFICYI